MRHPAPKSRGSSASLGRAVIHVLVLQLPASCSLNGCVLSEHSAPCHHSPNRDRCDYLEWPTLSSYPAIVLLEESCFG